MAHFSTLLFFASTLCTIGFLPLLWKTWRGQSPWLPTWFLLAYAAGVVFWLVYGITAQSAYLMTLGVLQLVQLLTVVALGLLSRTPNNE